MKKIFPLSHIVLLVLQRRHLFGRLRLQQPEVPEPTAAKTKLGRLQAKKAAPDPYTKMCNFELLKSYLLIKVFFYHIYLYKLLLNPV